MFVLKRSPKELLKAGNASAETNDEIIGKASVITGVELQSNELKEERKIDNDDNSG